MNKLIICGNLTADPILNEREYTDKNTGEIIKAKVCNFTVAAEDSYGIRKKTEFFSVTAWRGLGETCAKYLSKGRQVLIEGPVFMNNYVDKNNNLHAKLAVRANEVQLLQDGKGVQAMTDPEPEEDMVY